LRKYYTDAKTGPNYTSSICCGCVVRLVVEHVLQQIEANGDWAMRWLRTSSLYEQGTGTESYTPLHAHRLRQRDGETDREKTRV